MQIGSHIRFDENKTINAVLYIAKKLRRKDIHKIFKVLYFADREHLSKYGRPISGDVYIAMNDGPVPSKLYDILKSVRGDSYFSGEEFKQYLRFVGSDIIKPETEPKLDVLSRTDIEHLDESIELYGHLSWHEVREKSHDYAWNKTPRNDRISFENIGGSRFRKKSGIHDCSIVRVYYSGGCIVLSIRTGDGIISADGNTGSKIIQRFHIGGFKISILYPVSRYRVSFKYIGSTGTVYCG